jgi:hypothetical protein
MKLVCPGWPDCGCGTQSGPHTCEYWIECNRRYREAGIDPMHLNPDGSDYHIMKAIDDEVAKNWGKL